MLRNGWHPRAPVTARIAECMTGQEPRPDQKDDEKKGKYPEAKARRPWPVFRQGAAEQQSSNEADCLRPHRDRGGALRMLRARELQDRGGRRARRQADADAHQDTPREHPPHVRCDRKQQSADERRKETGQHRRAAANLVGNTAEADQHDNDDNRIDGEDSCRHRMGEMPFLGIKPVRQCRRRTCPKRMTDHARRNQQTRAAPEDEPPPHRRLSPVHHGTANRRRRYLDHRFSAISRVSSAAVVWHRATRSAGWRQAVDSSAPRAAIIWPTTVGSTAAACSQPIKSRHSKALLMKSSECPASANTRSVPAANISSASAAGAAPAAIAVSTVRSAASRCRTAVHRRSHRLSVAKSGEAASRARTWRGA